MTKATEQPVGDATVDAYRDIMQIKRNLATQEMNGSSIQPGAGVDPRKVIKPSKRLRNWHRANRHGLSLRGFARAIASGSLVDVGGDAKSIAKRWLSSKGIAA